MRSFLLSLLVILTLPTLAQNEYLYRISSVMSEDATQTLTYYYSDPTGSDLRGVHEINLLEDPVWELINSLQYDEEGKMTSWMLDFDNYEFEKAEITYTADGLIEKEIIMQDVFIGTFENLTALKNKFSTMLTSILTQHMISS